MNWDRIETMLAKRELESNVVKKDMESDETS